MTYPTHVSNDMEYIPGHGYYWLRGGKVYQEEQLIDGTPLPIGYTDYGRRSWTIEAQSHSDGFWVSDRLGSYHRHPFKTLRAAEAYAAILRGEDGGA